MMLLVFTVHDAAVEAYLKPFFARSPGEAIRSFIEASNNPKSEIFQHSKDYTLFQIGTYDDTKGLIEPLIPHRPLGKAIDFKSTDV